VAHRPPTQVGGAALAREAAISDIRVLTVAASMVPLAIISLAQTPHLVVEVDGEFHGERQEQDGHRTACLESRGYLVSRFQAIEILVDLDAVLETLLIEPDPPARGRGHQALTGHGLPPATTGVRYLAAGSL
jgi:Protein of unknown function (DUF559)